MAKKRLPFIDESKLKANPLVSDSFRIKGLRRPKLLADGTNTPDELEVQHYTKIYHHIDNRDLMKGLSPVSLVLFWWLVQNVKPGHDWLQINKSYFMSNTGFKSPHSFKKAIEELSIERIIYPAVGVKSVYWINPRIFFCGDRLKKFSEHVDWIEGKPKGTNQEEQPFK